MNPGPGFLITADCNISIKSRDDVADAVGASLGRSMVLAETDLGPAFFDLRSGLAGELIQKFVNYRVRVAIIIPRVEEYGPRFRRACPGTREPSAGPLCTLGR